MFKFLYKKKKQPKKTHPFYGIVITSHCSYSRNEFTLSKASFSGAARPTVPRLIIKAIKEISTESQMFIL